MLATPHPHYNDPTHGYLGNDLVKRAGVSQSFTEYEQQEYLRCMQNPAYFAKKYGKIISLDKGLVSFDLWPYQEKMYEHFEKYRFSVVLAPRQSGKCVHPDTIITIKFLDSSIEDSFTIKFIFELFARINRLQYERTHSAADLLEKVSLSLRTIDPAQAEKFDRLWRTSSYSSQKSWWIKFFGKPSQTFAPRTLYSASNTVKSFSPKYSRMDIDADSCVYDGQHPREFSHEFQDISSPKRILSKSTVDQHGRRKKSFLRSYLGGRRTPQGILERSSQRLRPKENIGSFKNSVDGSEVYRTNEISSKKRKDSKAYNGKYSTQTESCSEKTLEFSGTYGKDENGAIERFCRNEIENEFNQTRKTKIGRNKKKDVIGGFGSTQIGRNKKKVIIGCTKSHIYRKNVSDMWQNRIGTEHDALPFHELPKTEKFIGGYAGVGFLIKTDTGFQDFAQIHETREFEEWNLIVENDRGNQKRLLAADTHIVYKAGEIEVFMKDLSIGDRVITEDGIYHVNKIEPTGRNLTMFDAGVRDESHRYYTNGILSHNSISVVMYLLWYACFHPDKPVAVLANKGATAREMLSRITLALENLPFFLQPGCRVLNKGSIAFDNNSTIFAGATSGSSIRGKSISLLYIDEFAFVQNAEEFYTSTYPVVTSGTTTRVIITSTPKGIGNMFHRIWEGAVQGTNEYKPFRVRWEDVPGRDERWKEETIKNTSQLQFDQEFSCSFVGTGSTLIEGNALMGLKAINPIYTQNNVKVYEKPIEKHNYILTCDVGRGKIQDYSVFQIIDVSVKPFKQVASFRSNTISPLLLPDVIYKYARTYNDAYVVIESNDQGVVVCNGLYYDLEYENMFIESAVKSDDIGVLTTKKTKRIGCSNLKDMIETNKLNIVDADTIVELSTFEAKGNSYEASEGNHDDTVMALVIFAWFAATDMFAQMADINLKDMLYSERLTLIEDDIVPVGFFSETEKVKEKYIVEGGDIWTSTTETQTY